METNIPRIQRKFTRTNGFNEKAPKETNFSFKIINLWRMTSSIKTSFYYKHRYIV